MPATLPISWLIRRFIWNSMFLLIYRKKTPTSIPKPVATQPPLQSIPLSRRIPEIGIDNIMVADTIPPEEYSTKMHITYLIRRLMYRFYPANQPGLPRIDRNIEKAMAEAITPRYTALYPAPQLPPELAGADGPDLGALALKSPFACFLERKDGALVWDFTDLANLELAKVDGDALHPVDCLVTFEPDSTRPGSLRAVSIRWDGRTFTPGDAQWHHARTIALCAASTQTSLVRHFNWVHLACGAHFAIATRNALPADHPICRLVWPHMFGTQNSNHLVTLGQMLPNGEFETIFSFSHRGMCDLFARTHGKYRISTIDPALDWQVRGLEDSGLVSPVQQNLTELNAIFRRHAAAFIDATYPTDAALRDNTFVLNWLAALDKAIPNGITALSGPITPDGLTKSGLARLIAGFIQMAAVQHEQLGSLLWNYQLWVDRVPTRVYKSGDGLPVDVFQRCVNANFNLNVRRTKLTTDFSYLAKTKDEEEVFLKFLRELSDLAKTYDSQQKGADPREFLWRIHPMAIDANINA